EKAEIHRELTGNPRFFSVRLCETLCGTLRNYSAFAEIGASADKAADSKESCQTDKIIQPFITCWYRKTGLDGGISLVQIVFLAVNALRLPPLASYQ
ncbi:MAG: hypothetical protein KAT27_06235, partial [Desulfobacterales bacterium]|nr:hypothetical protein [Desulfobacterales bacterium]